jgi:D-sedoheptulose 7-phosphate isomerase
MNSNYHQFILDELQESAAVQLRTAESQSALIQEIAACALDTLRNGGKLIFFGNGGSAADAQHLAAELVGHYRQDRRALAAIALSADTVAMTAISNDYGYETLFARQIEALAAPGDLVIGISTSGNSPNVLAGLAAAKQRGAKTVGFTGANGARLAAVADLCLLVPSQDTAHIQETHMSVGHIICDIIERELFPQQG